MIRQMRGRIDSISLCPRPRSPKWKPSWRRRCATKRVSSPAPSGCGASALPDWLQHRRAEGQIRIGTLTAGDATIRAIRSRVIWDRGVVQLSNIEGRLEEGTFKGSGVVDITKSEPQYKLHGRAQNLAWKNGRVDLDGSLQTLGAGLDLLLNVHGEGAFQARWRALTRTNHPDRHGIFAMSLTRIGPQFKLSDVEATLGSERFTGEGITLADGRLQMELASPSRTVRVNLDTPR